MKIKSKDFVGAPHFATINLKGDYFLCHTVSHTTLMRWKRKAKAVIWAWQNLDDLDLVETGEKLAKDILKVLKEIK